jgi:pimeloyl-ACP methyl ester carboxylesterase
MLHYSEIPVRQAQELRREMSPKTVVFVHGMYMTPLCWEGWVGRFEHRGYHCLAPAWPGRNQPVEALRGAHPDPKLARLTLKDVVEHLGAVIQELPDKPVVIGHSMGGLVTQLLLGQALAAAAVAIDSAPPQGLFVASWPFLKSNWPHITPFAPKSRPIDMSFARFQYTFVNGLPQDEQRAAFDRYVVPESRRVPAQSLTSFARVDFKKPGAPLLMVAGQSDHIIPASLVRMNYRRYGRPNSVTELKEFPERAHFIIGQKGWEDVADYVLAWLDRALT